MALFLITDVTSYFKPCCLDFLIIMDTLSKDRTFLP